MAGGSRWPSQRSPCGAHGVGGPTLDRVDELARLLGRSPAEIVALAVAEFAPPVERPPAPGAGEGAGASTTPAPTTTTTTIVYAPGYPREIGDRAAGLVACGHLCCTADARWWLAPDTIRAACDEHLPPTPAHPGTPG